MKEKQLLKISAHFKIILMIWITHNKINGVATDVSRVRADESRHFIGEVNIISNGFVTMRNHANKLRGHKAVPNNGSYWLASFDTTNGNNSVMIIIMGTILFKHRIYCIQVFIKIYDEIKESVFAAQC